MWDIQAHIEVYITDDIHIYIYIYTSSRRKELFKSKVLFDALNPKHEILNGKPQTQNPKP